MFREMKEKTYIKLTCKILLYHSEAAKVQWFIFAWMELIPNQMSYVQTYKMNLNVNSFTPRTILFEKRDFMYFPNY